MSDGPADKLPTTQLPQVTNSPQKTGVALPPKVDPAPGAVQQADTPEPLERRVYTLHALVVQQQVQIGALRNEVTELKERIADFNKRSPHTL